MAAKQLTVPITVLLRESSLKALTQGSFSPSEALNAQVSTYLEQTADGGATLTVDQVREIEANYGKRIRSGADVVAATAKRAGKEGGKNVLTFTIDPTWMGPLEQRANEAGRPLSEMLSDFLEYAFEQDWFTTLTPQHPPLYVPDMQVFKDLTGSDRPSGEEVVAAVKELMKGSRKAKREEVAA